MPGTFSKSARPRRPGAYVNFEATAATRVPASQGSTVAVPQVHSWGPFKVATLCDSYEDFKQKFGNYTSPLDSAVRQAFRGEGILGRGGAGAVLVYRFGAAAAAKATRALQNTTPAAAVTISARYEGTQGNNITLTTADNAVNAANNDLIVKVSGTVVETYTYADTDIASLVTAINASSLWITAVQTITGVGLAVVTDQALTGGNDGATILAADYTAVMTALEVERFGVLAPYDLTDGPTLVSLVSWAKSMNAYGRRFMTVVGGASSDTATTAVTRSASINDPNFVNIGVGTVTDADLGVLSTAQFAPRLAGVIAARGESKQISMARFAGLTALNAGASRSQIDQAYDGGVVVLARDTQVDAPIRVEKGLTTYTTRTDPTRPYKVFSNPKFVRTMHGIENEYTAFAEAPGISGELPVNDKTRNLLVGEVVTSIKAREALDILQPGSTVTVDNDPPPSDDDEFVGLRIGLKFGRTVEQVFFTIGVA